MKFEIKNRWNSEILFSLETDSIKLCVEAAIKARINLSYADLSSADLRYANLRYANLRYADLRSADLRSADLRSAYLRYADLRSAYLSSADLRSANLSYAILSSADLRYADLRSADLRYADLRYANLSYANLSYADLRSADLRSADLRYADLRYAILSYANLRSADLSYADLRSAILSYAKGINPFLCTPLKILLDQPGEIRAYKLVNKNGIGPFNGGITYKIKETYEVKDADTNENEQCAKGISLATLDWCMREWRKGCRILIAEFTKEDIAAIPIATDGKFRVFRCKIIGEKDLKEIGLVK